MQKTAAKSSDAKNAVRIALIGNQNCGKTTLYNALTGKNRRVGNYPGVTVDGESSVIRLDGGECELVDLPGVYSLRPYSAEERVTREYLLRERPDGIINVVDATSPARGLYLTTRVLDLGIPVVLALNMMDEVQARGGRVDACGLEDALGVPVVAISASHGDGTEEVLNAAVKAANDLNSITREPERVGSYARAGAYERPDAVERYDGHVRHGKARRGIKSGGLNAYGGVGADTYSTYAEITGECEDIIYTNAENAGLPPKFAAMLAIEGDGEVLDALALDKNKREALDECVRKLERETGLDAAAASASARYKFVDGICRKYVSQMTKKRFDLDGAALNGALAYPIFALVMALVFWLTFDVVGGRLSELMADACGALSEFAVHLMREANVHPVLIGAVADGVLAGVGAVLSFLPLVVTLFLFLSVLEDTGYMARAAFIMDAPLRRLGLSGKSIVPLLLGFGCSVPAVMASRTLPTERDRRVTVMLVPFMSCGAKIPIYALFASYFFPRKSSLLIFSIYAFGVLLAAVSAAVLKRAMPGSAEAEYVLELPGWRAPTAKNIMRLLRRRAGEFLSRAFGVVLLASVAVWALSSFDPRLRLTYDAEQSILAAAGRILAPVFAPLGFGDWRAASALLTGLSAKEAVIGTLAVLTGEGGIGSVFTRASALSFMSFTLLYTPCAAAVTSIRGELGSAKLAAAALGAGLINAWCVSFFVYRAALLFL